MAFCLHIGQKGENDEKICLTLIDLTEEHDSWKLGFGVVWNGRVKDEDSYRL